MADLFQLKGTIVINNKEANEEIDETTGKAKDLGDALTGTGRSADDTAKKIGSSGKLSSGTVWLGNMFTKMTDMAVNVGKFIGRTGFGFNASMEAYQNQFASLLGDADKAAKLVADLQLLAKVSPLGMEGLANNAVSLLNTGTELADIIPTLEMLGNLSLGDPNKMDSIVRAYTQILSKGQLMAQEMYQLGDAGVPVREIMTLYGGERYADGEWYAEKMSDPTYKIMAEDMVKAFHAATAEGGKWHDYMFNMMDTWNGQVDRMGEEGKESLGMFMNPFFEMAKTEVLPKMADSLALFGTWASENQETIAKIAEALGNFATASFDTALDFFKWMTENGETVTAILAGIGAALAVGAIAAHPYAAAIMAVVAGLTLLNEHAKKEHENYLNNLNEEMSAPHRLAGKYAGWTEDQKTAAQNYITDYLGGFDTSDAVLELRNVGLSEEAITDFRTDMSEALNDSDFTVEISDTWFEEGTEANLQNQINNMTFDAAVHLYTDNSNLDTLYSIATGNGIDGSHASGLDRVPRDGYIARLHKDEAVLNSTMAAAYRNGTMGGGTGRLEGMLSQVLAALEQMAANMGGQQIVLDSGVLVGQLAPAMDVRLGTLTSRKGRRN